MKQLRISSNSDYNGNQNNNDNNNNNNNCLDQNTIIPLDFALPCGDVDDTNQHMNNRRISATTTTNIPAIDNMNQSKSFFACPSLPASSCQISQEGSSSTIHPSPSEDLSHNDSIASNTLSYTQPLWDITPTINDNNNSIDLFYSHTNDFSTRSKKPRVDVKM